MRFSTSLTLSLILGLASVSNALAEGDATKGKKVFKKCAACHFADKTKNKVGPTLQNVFGRTAGTVEGYKFSPAMIEAGAGGLVWNDETIAEYLKKPKDFIKKNKMAFAGLKKDDQIADLLTYLKQFSETMEEAPKEAAQ